MGCPEPRGGDGHTWFLTAQSIAELMNVRLSNPFVWCLYNF